jgi:hypothetical protein
MNDLSNTDIQPKRRRCAGLRLASTSTNKWVNVIEEIESVGLYGGFTRGAA